VASRYHLLPKATIGHCKSHRHWQRWLATSTRRQLQVMCPKALYLWPERWSDVAMTGANSYAGCHLSAAMHECTTDCQVEVYWLPAVPCDHHPAPSCHLHACVNSQPAKTTLGLGLLPAKRCRSSTFDRQRCSNVCRLHCGWLWGSIKIVSRGGRRETTIATEYLILH
jgi:hypothetical protein